MSSTFSGEGKKVRNRLFLLALLIFFSFFLLYILRAPQILPEQIREKYIEYFHYIEAAVSIALGIIVIQSIASITTSRLKELGPSAFVARNIIMILGYIAIAFIALSFFEITGVISLAGATFSGLIFGFGLQPVMANFFAGLILLFTGHLKPGKVVKVSGTSLPISIVAFPPYKLFSINEYMPSITGTVVEIGLMFTKILSAHGELVKIPNNILLTSGIVREEITEEKRVRIRYEIPISCDPESTLSELEGQLSSESDIEIYIEEQSDKGFYILNISARVPPHEKLMKYRSRLLAKVIKAHRSLLQKGICEQKQST
ncbi:MAG: mechanosensitive ion channel family protein [Fervidicoccaceae archaeon]